MHNLTGDWTIDGGIASVIAAIMAAALAIAVIRVYKQQTEIQRLQKEIAKSEADFVKRDRLWKWYYGVTELVDAHLGTGVPRDDLEHVRYLLEADGQSIMGKDNLYVQHMKDITSDIRRLKRDLSKTNDGALIQRLNGAIYQKEKDLKLQRDTLYSRVQRQLSGPLKR